MSSSDPPPPVNPSEQLPAGLGGQAGGSAPREDLPRPGRTEGRSRRNRERAGAAGGGNMLPRRDRRRFRLERLLVRLIATGGVVGIGVALGAILTSNKVAGWIIGLVIAVVSIVLSGLLWSSRQL